MSLQLLLNIMKKLRSPDGCPWDREQTHQSLKRYLVEEAYEVLEAIDQHEPELLVDELGDVLLQVVFHAQIASEQGTFDMDDIITAISDKLVRRHPHVFADVQVETAADVAKNWEEIKGKEPLGKERTSLLDGVPREFPALMRAEKIQKKAAKVGFEWDDHHGAHKKLLEELGELQEAMENDDPTQVNEELGDVFFAMVNVARYAGVDPEFALQDATGKFIKRFQYIEEIARQDGKELQDMTLAEMDAIWDAAKAHFRKNPHA